MLLNHVLRRDEVFFWSLARVMATEASPLMRIPSPVSELHQWVKNYMSDLFGRSQPSNDIQYSIAKEYLCISPTPIPPPLPLHLLLPLSFPSPTHPNSNSFWFLYRHCPPPPHHSCSSGRCCKPEDYLSRWKGNIFGALELGSNSSWYVVPAVLVC